jgi:hypothetical protein
MRLDAATTTTSLVLSLLTLSSVALAARPKDAILLSEVRTAISFCRPLSHLRPPKLTFFSVQVKSLTLRSPQKTTGRRLAPVPQLKCLSNPRLCQMAAIKTMRCLNEGSSYTSGVSDPSSLPLSFLLPYPPFYPTSPQT